MKSPNSGEAIPGESTDANKNGPDQPQSVEPSGSMEQSPSKMEEINEN